MKRTAGALQRLTDDSNFICESSKRKTIFKEMFVSGEAFLHSMNLLQQKLLPHTYRGYRRTILDLQEHERQIYTINDDIDAVCFF